MEKVSEPGNVLSGNLLGFKFSQIFFQKKLSLGQWRSQVPAFGGAECDWGPCPSDARKTRETPFSVIFCIIIIIMIIIIIIIIIMIIIIIIIIIHPRYSFIDK